MVQFVQVKQRHFVDRVISSRFSTSLTPATRSGGTVGIPLHTPFAGRPHTYETLRSPVRTIQNHTELSSFSKSAPLRPPTPRHEFADLC